MKYRGLTRRKWSTTVPTVLTRVKDMTEKLVSLDGGEMSMERVRGLYTQGGIFGNGVSVQVEY